MTAQNKIIIALFTILCISSQATTEFSVPPVDIQALQPTGIRISILDQPGIKLFTFNGRINEDIAASNVGEIEGSALSPDDGRWKIIDQNVVLSVGDVVNYWVYVQYNQLGYRHENLKYKVDRLYSESDPWPNGPTMTAHFTSPQTSPTNRPQTSPTERPQPTGTCDATSTTINGGRKVCSGELIFEENFDNLNKSRWIIENRLPSEYNEYPFVLYSNQDSVVNVKSGQLNIVPDLLQNTPTLSEDDILTGNIDLFSSCTGIEEQCELTASGSNILPPIISGRISSRKAFSFKYGIIEIRAKVPVGDWLYPELFLEPLRNRYGSDSYSSGMMRVGLVRGNVVLRDQNEDYKVLDNKVVYAGIVLDQFTCHNKWLSQYVSSKSLANDFHIYSLTWQPESITLSIDGIKYGVINAPDEGFGSFSKECSITDATAQRWSRGTSFAPFDEEFYIALGVGAGGVTEFPDNVLTSNGKKKPWANLSSKAKLRFWQKLSDWKSTWGEGSSLKVDSVRVWAL